MRNLLDDAVTPGQEALTRFNLDGPAKVPARASLLSNLRPYDVVVGLIGLVFLSLIAYPMLGMLYRTFVPEGSFDLGAISRTFDNPQFLPAARNTVLVVALSGSCALTLAVVFAWINERTDARMRWASAIFPLMPLLLPPIILSIGWIFLANRQAGLLNVAIRGALGWVGIDLEEGPVNISTMPGLIFVFTLFLLPYAYLIIAAAMRNIDPALEEASRVSGASLAKTFWRVTLGSIKPAIAAAGLLVVIIGFSGYSMAATIGVSARVDMLSVHLVRLVQSYPSKIDQAVTVGVLVLVFIGSIWFMQHRMLQGGGHARIAGRATTSLVRLGPWKWVARGTILVYLLAASVLPLATVFLVALQQYWTPQVAWSELSFENFTELLSGASVARRALQTSVMLGVIGATIGIAIATVLALYASRRQTRIGSTVEALLKAPGAISHIVLGVAFIVAFAGQPFYLGGTTTILLLAYLVMYMPQASLAADSGIRQVPAELVEASAMAGAGHARTLRKVVVPLVLPALAAGWAMLFLVMAGDLTASALLSTTRSPVVGYVILAIWSNGTFAPLAALGAILGLISAVVVGLVLILSSRRR